MLRELLLCGSILVPSFEGTAVSADDERRDPVVKCVEKTRGMVVNIRGLKNVPAKVNTDGAGRVRNLGTGVIIDPRGYVVTNYHVVEGVQTIDVVASDGSRLVARLFNFDTRADLALLKIEGGDRKFPYATLADGEGALLGERVVAIGNPFGLENSITEGRVASVKRLMELPNGETHPDLIQVNGSINPGNSGGPLFAIDGTLLGITCAIRSNAQGIAFAIPSKKVLEVIDRLMPTGSASVERLGLRVEKALPKRKAENSNSVFVSYVEPKSFAAKHLQPNDQIIEADGQRVDTPFDLHRVLWERRLGDTLQVKIKRGNQNGLMIVDLRLQLPSKPTDEDEVFKLLGMSVTPVAKERVQAVWDKLAGGLLVLSVAPKTPAARAGLRAGDIVYGLHNLTTETAGHVLYIANRTEGVRGQKIECSLIRDGATTTTQIEVPDRK